MLKLCQDGGWVRPDTHCYHVEWMDKPDCAVSEIAVLKCCRCPKVKL